MKQWLTNVKKTRRMEAHKSMLHTGSMGRYVSNVSTVLIRREPSLWRLPSCFGDMLFCGDIVVRGRCYESNVSTVLMGREPSRDLRRHSSSFACHVTVVRRLPWCFGAMLFCDDTVTRGRCYESNVSTVLLMGREPSRDL